MTEVKANCSTEKLIEIVKRNRVLYDMSHPDYKNIRLKNKIWDEIATERGSSTGEELKKKWKNIRDCFSKYLRSEKTRTGQAAASICRYKTWPFAQQMLFLKPFLHYAPTETNVASQDENLGIVENEIEKSGPHKIVAQKRKHSAVASETTSNVEKVMSFLDKRHKEYDSIDLTFQGYAASIKKLSDHRQTMIKFKIAKMIMEEELAQQMEWERENPVISSFSNKSVASFNSSSSSTLDHSNTVDTDFEAAGACWYPNSSNDLNL